MHTPRHFGVAISFLLASDQRRVIQDGILDSGEKCYRAKRNTFQCGPQCGLTSTLRGRTECSYAVQFTEKKEVGSPGRIRTYSLSVNSRAGQKSKCRVWCRLHKTRSHSYFSSCTQSCTQTALNQADCVFDLDGTLAVSKSPVDPEVLSLLHELLGIVKVAVISGGDWPEFEKQLLSDLPSDDCLSNLFLLPACGTKFFSFAGIWEKLYSEDFLPLEKTKIKKSLETLSTVPFSKLRIHGERP